MKKYSLPVEGMTCAACVARVEKAVSRIEGLENVSVNIATEKVSFDVKKTGLDLEKIADVVEDTGYRLKLEVDAPAAELYDENTGERSDTYA